MTNQPTAARPEVDDPRVLALAKARQQLAYENPFNAVCPPWDGLSEREQHLSLLGARSYLHAAIRAGLTTAPAAAGVAPATDEAGPVCKSEQGCHRVVPCAPGCGTRDLLAEALAANRESVDQTERRDRYAQALHRCGVQLDDAGSLADLDDPQQIAVLADAVMAVADAEQAARRAADLRDAEEICDEAGATYTGRALNDHAAAAYELMERFRRKAEEAEQTAAVPPAATPAVDQTAETDEQRADRLETERDHAAGSHQYCGVTCEVEFPSEMLRNGILAKGYPGTAGMLDELLRRAATVAALPDTSRAATLREAIQRVEDPAERAKTTTGMGLGWESARDVLRRMADEEQQTGHVYLSTGCYHGDQQLPDGRTGHQYCQSMTGLNGTKRPGACKVCDSKCICSCHRATAEESTP